MSIINHIAKYSLESESFNNGGILDNNSLSIVVDRIISDESNPCYECVILVNGNRALDVTKDGVHPEGKRDYVKRICDYFKNKNKNVIVEHILLDNDAPLALEARIIATHVDKISSDQNINTVNLIGHSKGGTILFNVPKYFRSNSSFEKTTITTTATPYVGCLLASSKIFLEHAKKVIYAQLPEHIAKHTYDALANYYNNLSSGSHMDNDIALPGYESDNYDPKFIGDMFNLLNINAMKKIRFYQNFVTWVDEYTILDALRRGDFTSVGLCLLDKFFMVEPTDGFVEKRSQESVEQHIEVKRNLLKSKTHYFLSHDDDLGIVLDSINNNIDEYNDNKRTLRFYS